MKKISVWSKINPVMLKVCFISLFSMVWFVLSGINHFPSQPTAVNSSLSPNGINKPSEAEPADQYHSERTLRKESKFQFKEWKKSIKAYLKTEKKSVSSGKSSDVWLALLSALFIMGGILTTLIGYFVFNIDGTDIGFVYLGIGLILVGIIFTLVLIIQAKKRKQAFLKEKAKANIQPNTIH